MYSIRKDPSSDGPQLKAAGADPNLTATTEFWELLQTLPEGDPVPPAILNFGLLTHHLSPWPDTISIDREKIAIEELPSAEVPAATLRIVRRLLVMTTDKLTTAEKERVGRLCDQTGLNRPPTQAPTTPDTTQSSTPQQPTVTRTCFEKKTDTVSQTTTQSATHPCSDCDQSFTSEDELSNHERVQHETAETEENQTVVCDNESSESEDTMQKKYECTHCTKKFKTEHNRDKHQNSCSKKSTNNPASSGSVGKSVRKDKRGERVIGKNPFADTSRLKDTGLHQGGG